jgi:hypothetical protein
MRTTLTLDPDVQSLIENAMRERGVSFKQAVNDAIRAGLMPARGSRFVQRTFSMGFRPEVNYDKALAIAAALDDEELIRQTSSEP